MAMVYTLPELAAEYKTSKDKIYILEELGEIKSIRFSSQKVVSVFEAERFLKENSGRSFEKIIKEAQKRKELEKLNKKVIEMKEVAR